MVGGSIAALVAADARLRRGGAVDLLLPRTGVAGGFAPIEVEGRRLGLGVRLLEIDREDAAPPPPLADYVAGPSGHVPFVRTLAEWTRELAGDGLREADGLAMVVDGRLADDIYFTVDLEGLRAALPAAEADRTAAEAADARRLDGDAGVLGAGHDLGALSLDDASRRNHGAAFHERFIAAMCRKIHPGGAAAVPAALRRKVWMPLFHPSTLEAAAAGRPTGYRPHRPFHTVEPGGVGALVAALLARIHAAPRARVVEAGRLLEAAPTPDGSQVQLRLEGLDRTVGRPVLGTSPAELFAAVGAGYDAPRLPMSIAWAEVDERDVLALPALVHVPDPEIDAFRISPGDPPAPGRRALTLEMRHDLPAEHVADAVRRAVVATGLVREGAPVEVVHHLAGPAMPDPGPGAQAAFEAARARLNDARLDAEVVGGAAAFGADSFNEQVIQGLRAEEATR
ncbi:MAG TPA: hypothetical protein PKD59_04900 [Miltoncostaeaceae bacterium]|nr:hypothetical protein [Miltoncostaeaceae bacterium]